MVIKFTIKDKHDKKLLSDYTTAFESEDAFVEHIRGEMDRLGGHYCYYKDMERDLTTWKKSERKKIFIPSQLEMFNPLKTKTS